MTVLFRNDQTFPAGKHADQAQPAAARLIPDGKFPALMWRVRWPDGALSDMVNLTRAKDALASFGESEDRRQRGRRSRAERPRSAQTQNMDAGS
jgi:hypothetical protein